MLKSKANILNLATLVKEGGVDSFLKKITFLLSL